MNSLHFRSQLCNAIKCLQLFTSVNSIQYYSDAHVCVLLSLFVARGLELVLFKIHF